MATIADFGDKALAVFQGALSCYSRDEDTELAFDTIQSLLTEAREVSGDAQKYGRNTAVSSLAILMLWDEAPKDLRLRYLDTGKTVEELQKEDEEEERKRKQSDAWRAQGLCSYCGGQLGMFKKCKSCGRKNYS